VIDGTYPLTMIRRLRAARTAAIEMDIRAQMDGIYERMAPEAIPWNKAEPPAILVEIVEAGVVAPCDTVDLGCGAGNYAVWLASRGFRVTGIDVSANAIAMAARLAAARGVLCRYLQGDLTAGVPDDLAGAFDFAYDWEVLHHVFPDVRAAYAANVRRLLRPGGRYLSVCFSEADAPAFGGQGKWCRTPIGTLLYLSSEQEIAELFEPLFHLDELHTVEIAGRHGTHLAVKALMTRRA
jgi:SAM-dependent methyltransferase